MDTPPAPSLQPQHDDICDIPGILVGHASNLAAGTGCTVIRCVWPALCSVDVRGGAPATRETDLLRPTSFMREAHAILLTGGSAFGLDAATGVMRVLEHEGIGFDTGVARVPIVPAAALFDLSLGRADLRPDPDLGEQATRAAHSGPVAQGSVGAGVGAQIGWMAGPQGTTKGGLGSASASLPGGYHIGALVAVNALGDIYTPTGAILAGARAPDNSGWLASTNAEPVKLQAGQNTTLAVIATDAPWAKAELAKLAQMAHDGLARAIRPAHTPLDGDVIFALSTARNGPTVDIAEPQRWTQLLAQTGELATTTLWRAIVKAIHAATSLHGVPALRDLHAGRLIA